MRNEEIIWGAPLNRGPLGVPWKIPRHSRAQLLFRAGPNICETQCRYSLRGLAISALRSEWPMGCQISRVRDILRWMKNSLNYLLKNTNQILGLCTLCAVCPELQSCSIRADTASLILITWCYKQLEVAVPSKTQCPMWLHCIACIDLEPTVPAYI